MHCYIAKNGDWAENGNTGNQISPPWLGEEAWWKVNISSWYPNSQFEVHPTLFHCFCKLLELGKHHKSIDFVGIIQIDQCNVKYFMNAKQIQRENLLRGREISKV